MCGNLEATSESGSLDRGIPKIELARLEWSAAPGVSTGELHISLLLETPSAETRFFNLRAMADD